MSGSASWGTSRGKRVADVVGAGTLLVLTMPLLLLLAFAVRVDLGAPVLYRQLRPGRGGQTFGIVKLRTMRPAAPGRELLDDETRLSRLGRWLRRTSLDELPELVNVLRGDMSLVGPRPLLVVYLERYTPEQARRHLVRPGITGLAQVNGRNRLSWEEKFRYDKAYVDGSSASMDLGILLRTVVQVVRPRGVDADGEVGAPEFLGSVARDRTSVRR